MEVSPCKREWKKVPWETGGTVQKKISARSAGTIGNKTD